MDENDLKIKSGGLVFLLSLVLMDLQLNTQNSSLNTYWPSPIRHLSVKKYSMTGASLSNDENDSVFH